MCYTRTEYYYYYSIVLKGVVHTVSLTFLEGFFAHQISLLLLQMVLGMAWPMLFDPKGLAKSIIHVVNTKWSLRNKLDKYYGCLIIWENLVIHFNTLYIKIFIKLGRFICINFFIIWWMILTLLRFETGEYSYYWCKISFLKYWLLVNH